MNCLHYCLLVHVAIIFANSSCVNNFLSYFAVCFTSTSNYWTSCLLSMYVMYLIVFSLSTDICRLRCNIYPKESPSKN